MKAKKLVEEKRVGGWKKAMREEKRRKSVAVENKREQNFLLPAPVEEVKLLCRPRVVFA